MLDLYVILALAFMLAPLAFALAPMLAGAGQSWPEANPEHRFASPARLESCYGCDDAIPAGAHYCATCENFFVASEAWYRASVERDVDPDDDGPHDSEECMGACGGMICAIAGANPDIRSARAADVTPEDVDRLVALLWQDAGRGLRA